MIQSSARINSIEEEDIAKLEAYGYLNDYQAFATKSAIYPGRGEPKGLMYCALKLNGEAGELAEHVGKAMRDDNYGAPYHGHGMNGWIELEKERKASLLKEIGDVLWYLSAICNELGVTLNDVAIMNLKKLRDRQLRNVQQGSGDNR